MIFEFLVLTKKLDYGFKTSICLRREPKRTQELSYRNVSMTNCNALMTKAVILNLLCFPCDLWLSSVCLNFFFLGSGTVPENSSNWSRCWKSMISSCCRISSSSSASLSKSNLCRGTLKLWRGDEYADVEVEGIMWCGKKNCPELIVLEGDICWLIGEPVNTNKYFWLNSCSKWKLRDFRERIILHNVVN